MANLDLVFGAALTIEQIKAVQGVTALTISRNPETQARYFDCGAVRGPVSKSFDSKLDSLISNCTNPDTGESFQMLHNRTLANVEETL